MTIYREEVISTVQVYDGKILNLRIDTVSLANGKTSTRELVEHEGGVGILPINQEGNIVLVKQYRIAAQDTLIEIPAGKLDDNEDPKDAAIRELREETGYDPLSIKKILSFYPTSGYSTEIIHLYQAYVGEKKMQDLDENEDIEVLECSLDEAMEMVKSSRIIDGKTIIAIMSLNMERLACK